MRIFRKIIYLSICYSTRALKNLKMDIISQEKRCLSDCVSDLKFSNIGANGHAHDKTGRLAPPPAPTQSPHGTIKFDNDIYTATISW